MNFQYYKQKKKEEILSALYRGPLLEVSSNSFMILELLSIKIDEKLN